MDSFRPGRSSGSSSHAPAGVRSFVPHLGGRPIRVYDLCDCGDFAAALHFRFGQGLHGDQVSLHHFSDRTLDREQYQLVHNGDKRAQDCHRGVKALRGRRLDPIHLLMQLKGQLPDDSLHLPQHGHVVLLLQILEHSARDAASPQRSPGQPVLKTLHYRLVLHRPIH